MQCSGELKKKTTQNSGDINPSSRAISKTAFKKAPINIRVSSPATENMADMQIALHVIVNSWSCSCYKKCGFGS